jgi:hypothetical protein
MDSSDEKKTMGEDISEITLGWISSSHKHNPSETPIAQCSSPKTMAQFRF